MPSEKLNNINSDRLIHIDEKLAYGKLAIQFSTALVKFMIHSKTGARNLNDGINTPIPEYIININGMVMKRLANRK